MGFFQQMFTTLVTEGEKLLNETSSSSSNAPPPIDPENPPTRWEKAVVGLNGIVQQVSKIDPDGIDVYCIPGTGDDGIDIYRNIKDTSGLKGMVTSQEPGGACEMGKVIDQVLNEAIERGFDDRPCSILVFTAGRPNDYKDLQSTIANAATKIEQNGKLNITFVQVGDDEWATNFLKSLDDDLTCTSTSGEEIDIVDTIKDEEIKEAFGEMKEEGFGGAGALFGAFAGAALGVGGMYLYNQMNAKKRTEGWNGTWKALQDGEQIAILTVKDDMEGNLTVEGWTGEEDGPVSTGQYYDNDDGYNLIRTPSDNSPDTIYGTVEDEHNISWSDGTRWEEIPPEDANWTHYAGAAAAGAALTGATGYLMQKKFFKNAADKVPSDYVIIMDRSQAMTMKDTGH